MCIICSFVLVNAHNHSCSFQRVWSFLTLKLQLQSNLQFNSFQPCSPQRVPTLLKHGDEAFHSFPLLFDVIFSMPVLSFFPLIFLAFFPHDYIQSHVLNYYNWCCNVCLKAGMGKITVMTFLEYVILLRDKFKDFLFWRVPQLDLQAEGFTRWHLCSDVAEGDRTGSRRGWEFPKNRNIPGDGPNQIFLWNTSALVLTVG